MTSQQFDWRCFIRRLAVAMFVFTLLAGSADAAPVELKVMSFNLRFSRGVPHEEKTENNWNDPKFPRRERAIRVIKDFHPDIFGLQEAREMQIKHVREALPEYEYYGVGRDDGKKGGEFCPLFFRKDRFTRVGAGSFWLSDTPDKPGTTFSTLPKALPRMASWVQLRDAKSGREFVVLNTHWDHLSHPARRKSGPLIRAQLEKIAAGLPAIVMGDLNSSEDTPAYRQLVASASGRRLIDSFRKLHPRRSPEEATANHWSGMTSGSRIDFILCSDDFQPQTAEIVRTSYDGRWPSDHFPVTATLAIEAR